MAKFSTELQSLRKQYGFNTANVFTTTNPKTGKNVSPTLVLHLEPITFGACPAAGSCAALCLNKSGNPIYLYNKLSRRQKRSHAFQFHPETFLQLVVIEAARGRSKGYVGMRLNGTSDHAWERKTVMIDDCVSNLIYDLCGIRIEPGTYTMIDVMNRLGFLCYDYTKRIDRDWHTPGYHLTLSWGGKHDFVVFDVAKLHGLNVAAPVYGVKKSQALPETITHSGVSYPVVDGDVTDWRRDDPSGSVHVVALRLKRTPGQTESLARKFCIA
jgi:hypothetical protein